MTRQARGLMLGLLLAAPACGKYGPPERTLPPEPSAQTSESAPEAAPLPESPAGDFDEGESEGTP